MQQTNLNFDVMHHILLHNRKHMNAHGGVEGQIDEAKVVLARRIFAMKIKIIAG